MSDETYQGWTNRETWALMLHINNDQGLSEMFRDAAQSGYWEPVRDLAEILCHPSSYRSEFGGERSEELEQMAYEVGSLWRVNWSEVVEALTEE